MRRRIGARSRPPSPPDWQAGLVAAYTFSQVDVFGSRPLAGNPVAVVHGAAGLDDGQMADFARWTNLSETTFLLPPEDQGDYRLRIFTPATELPFAGHPTLGSAHAWLEAGGVPADGDRVVQECGLGLVELRRGTSDLGFKAPDLVRGGEVDDVTLERALTALGVRRDRVLRANWVDNGPGWLGLHLRGADDVLALRPDFAAMGDLQVGVIGRLDIDQSKDCGADYEVRAFCPELAVPEDPVTGSLNAGLAVWLTREGYLPGSYVARQGTAVGRDGRVRVSTDGDGAVWVAGTSRTVLSGIVDL